MSAHRLGTLLLSAALIRLSFPPFDMGPLMFVAWVPFLVTMRRLGWRPALAFGFVHGFALGLGAHAWIVSAAEVHADLPRWQAVMAFVAVAGLCGLRSALVGAAVAFCCARRVSYLLSFPIVLPCAELLLSGFFPWTNALAMHSLPVWTQAAAWGGAALVSAWLCLVNALVARGLSRWLQTRSMRDAWGGLAAATVVVLLAGALGLILVSQEQARASAAARIRVAVAHVVLGDKFQSDLVPELRTMTLAHQERSGVSDLVLWPEGVSPLPLSTADASDLARRYWLRDRQLAPDAPQIRSRLLLGVSLKSPEGLHNSAVLLDHGGRVLGGYSKQNLVPLGETGLLPHDLAKGALSEGVTSYRPAPNGVGLNLDGHGLAVSICFEDILTDAVRAEVLRTHAELLLNLTSDHWFAGTSAVAFHFALAKLRAVEQRRYLVRSTVDGVSAVIDSMGQVVVHAAGAPSRMLEGEVPLLTELTPYTRFASVQRLLWFLLGALVLAQAGRTAPTGTRTD